MKRIMHFGPLFVMIAALLWSFDGILRRSLYTLPPAVIVFYEHILGAVILLILFKKWFPDLKKMRKKEWIAIGLVSLFSGALGTIFYTGALGQVNFIQFSVVVLLQQLQPIWAILAARLLLKEPLRKNFLIWAGVALVAAYLITFKTLSVNLSTGQGTMIAGLLALAAGMLWGSSTAISKYVLNKVSFLTATALRFFLAPVFALMFIVSQKQTGQLFTLSMTQWGTLVLIALSTGMVALAIYYYGLKKTPARITTLYELVWPASAVFIDYFFYHNGLSVTQGIGVVLLAGALWKVTRKSKDATVSAPTG
ncbi:MAG: DMT family transporter [bacterium]|nr:DMT family transporter [bacterium]